MKIKDFIAGQTVYIVGGGIKARSGLYATKAEVEKVGRKYVTISGRWEEKFREPHGDKPYLIEQTEYGSPRLLFPSEQAVYEYREREELKDWVRCAGKTSTTIPCGNAFATAGRKPSLRDTGSRTVTLKAADV